MTDLLLRELLDFVEREFGAELRGRLCEASGRDAGDLRRLVAALPAAQALGVDAILYRFGRQLFARFAALYPAVFAGPTSARELLLEVAPRVHDELRVHQPRADLPELRARDLGPGRIEVEYRSARGLADLAEGVLRGCLDYYGAPAELHREESGAASGAVCRFVVQWRGAPVRSQGNEEAWTAADEQRRPELLIADRPSLIASSPADPPARRASDSGRGAACAPRGSRAARSSPGRR